MTLLSFALQRAARIRLLKLALAYFFVQAPARLCLAGPETDSGNAFAFSARTYAKPSDNYIAFHTSRISFHDRPPSEGLSSETLGCSHGFNLAEKPGFRNKEAM